MREVKLKHCCRNDKLFEATFLPDQGMNLSSLKYGDLELIDQSTKGLFDDHLGGLGPIIGPHFYQRDKVLVAHVPDDNMFPHISRVYKSGKVDPFSHGIGRYVSWNWSSTDRSISANISGLDACQGVTLAALEGFNFDMEFRAKMHDSAMDIYMSVQSMESPTVAGLHYYYAINGENGRVVLPSVDKYCDRGAWRSIPDEWRDEYTENVVFDLVQESDYTFKPNTSDFTGIAVLETDSYSLKIGYEAGSDEHAFQLYHPQNASYVCIEPITATNPREAKSMKNTIKIRMEID